MSASRSLSAFRSRARARVVTLALAIALPLVLVLASCGERPRTNPLDPQNPETGGGPSDFRALAGNHQVELRWRAAPPNAQLAGFMLERRRHGPNPYVELVPLLPTSVNSYLDQTVQNDIEYDYRLTYLLPGGGVSGTPSELTSRPGREIVWVADPGADEVARIGPDGRSRILTLSGIAGVNRVSVQLSGGEIWATSPVLDRVFVHSVTGALLNAFSGPREPNALAVDATSGTAWICEEAPGSTRVRRYTQPGIIVGNAGAFGLPTDVAVAQGGEAWIVDQASGQIRRVNAAGTELGAADVGSDPRRIAVNSLDGSVWVSRHSAGEVVHVSSGGTILGRITGLDGPFAVDIDEARNQVWIGLDLGNAVEVYATSDRSFKFRVPGISRPRGLAVADNTGECWVTAIGAHELVQISSTGVIQVRNSAFAAPFDVRVDPGPR